jgi:hypothetical protein
MTMSTKKEIAAAEVTAAVIFNRIGKGVQFSIFDLGKISQAAEQVLLAGGTEQEAEAAMAEAIAKYRKN